MSNRHKQNGTTEGIGDGKRHDDILVEWNRTFGSLVSVSAVGYTAGVAYACSCRSCAKQHPSTGINVYLGPNLVGLSILFPFRVFSVQFKNYTDSDANRNLCGLIGGIRESASCFAVRKSFPTTETAISTRALSGSTITSPYPSTATLRASSPRTTEACKEAIRAEASRARVISGSFKANESVSLPGFANGSQSGRRSSRRQAAVHGV